jgi:hypothetical protein
MAHPVIDAGFGGGGGMGPMAKCAIARVLTILKKSSKVQDEGVYVQVFEIPFSSLQIP